MACFGGATEGIEDVAAASGRSLQRESIPTASGHLIESEGSLGAAAKDNVDPSRKGIFSAVSLEPSGDLATGLCSTGMGDLRNIADTPRFQDCAMEASEWGATFATAGSTIESFNFCGALIPSFSSDSSSFGNCELRVLSASKPVMVADTADSQRAEREATNEEGSWLDFELFASEVELRLGEQVSDLLVCPEIEDASDVCPSSELAASARAHISKVLLHGLV